MRNTSAGLLLAFFCGCYSPQLGSPGFYCHEADKPACPDGQSCVSGRCVDKGLLIPDGGHPQDLAAHPGDDLALPPGTPVDLAQPQGGCAVRINEVQTAGSAGAQDEFIELYNSCSTAAPLVGYQLVYRSASGTTDVNILSFTTQSVPAGGYLVAGQTNYSGSPDVRYTASGLAAAGGGLALLDSSMATVDSMGYGTASNAFVHGSPAPAPASAQSVERLPDGHASGNDSTDFVIGAPPTPGATNR